MKRLAILFLALCTAMTLAACGGGGGGGGGAANPNPAFSATDTLDAPVGATPAFSTATAVDDGAGSALDPTMVVGAADDTAAPTNLQAVVWTVTPGVAPAPTTNIAANLPTPVGTTYSRANGMNNAGMIVGEMGDPIVPAFWADSLTPAVALDLGGAVSGAAYAIDNDGGIVGETFAVAGGPATAVFWEVDELGVITGPTPLPTTGTSSSAYAVNNNLTVPEAAGEMTDLAGTHAVVWRVTDLGTDVIPPTIIEIVLPGLPTAIPALNGDAVAFSINNAGTVIGEIADADGFVHAVRWVKGTVTLENPTGYTVQDMSIGAANAINNGGRVVGIATVTTTTGTPPVATPVTGAGAWGSGGTVPILMHANLAGGQANAISNTGRAVGTVNNQAFIALP
jgi:uncharacterized membrane protein